jgi:hypothetical protein
MSIRVDVADVQELLTATASEVVLQGHIVAASLWIDNYLVGKCSALSVSKLPTIEKYLAAHLYTVAQQGGTGPLIEARRADIAEKYAAPSDSGRGDSTYLHTAVAFDPCGVVAEHFLNRKRVKWRVGAGYRSTTGGP